MTERLYYADSFLTDFEAEVVAALDQPRPTLILDRTAFYPTSGGQVHDTGFIEANGGRLRVLEVAEREDGAILHYLETQATIGKGTRVRGTVDAARRRDHMQQHSGQHVLSAAFIRLFEMPTVSFHMGDDTCSVDLATNALKSEQMERVSQLSNEVVFEDRPVAIRYATMDEARALGVRKLPDHVEGKLRLINILDFDLNACGGTHVHSTGQIGPILLRRSEKVKQGTRVEFVCGERAVAVARRDFATLTEAAALFSTHIWEVPLQVRKSLDEVKTAQKQQHRMLEEIAELMAARLLAETEAKGAIKLIVRSFADREAAFIKLLAQKLTKEEKSVVALLASTAGQPSLVFAQSPSLPFDMGSLMKEATAQLGGRGGGSRDLAQGGATQDAKLEETLGSVATRISA